MTQQPLASAGRPSLAQAFGASRMGIGVLTWVAPSLATRAFGLGAASEQPIIAQLFGAREFALGFLTATSRDAALEHVLRVGVAIDAVDTVASVRQVRAGAFSTQAKLLTGLGAAAFTAIGVRALASGR